MKVEPFAVCLLFNPAITFLNSVLKCASEISTTLRLAPVFAAVSPTVDEGVDMLSNKNTFAPSLSSSHTSSPTFLAVFSKPSENCNKTSHQACN